jgi:catechol-2,3-dioxygenase
MTGTPSKPSAGAAVNHLVLNVRDLEASHRFYTEIMGFELCGELGPERPNKMRFYRGAPDHHHDLALMQVKDPSGAEPPERWSMTPRRVGVNHIAIAYPDREAFLNQLEHLRANGVEFIVRGNHGMTHSAYIEDPDGYGLEVLYELPEEVWGADVNGALNYFEVMPTDGPESLVDDTNYRRFSPAQG